MRPLGTLRSRLIAMVAALVAVTIGTVAVISTRVAHYEIRKFDVEVHAGRRLPSPGPIAEHYRAHGWTGIQTVVDRVAQSASSDVLLFDAQRRLIASSNAALHDARFDLAPDGTLTIERVDSRSADDDPRRVWRNGGFDFHPSAAVR
jgi:hypothetical protein